MPARGAPPGLSCSLPKSLPAEESRETVLIEVPRLVGRWRWQEVPSWQTDGVVRGVRSHAIACGKRNATRLVCGNKVEVLLFT